MRIEHVGVVVVCWMSCEKSKVCNNKGVACDQSVSFS